MTTEAAWHAAMNRLAKWRSTFTGWQLGTRSDKDPESLAVRDHREGTLMARIEISAIAKLLIDKGVFTADDLRTQMVVEADAMHVMLEKKFPGFKAMDYGMSLSMPEVAETLRKFPP